MANKGENYNQTAPTIAVSGSVSGSFTVTGANTPYPTTGGADTTSTAKVNNWVVKYDEATPTIRGTATITVTVPGGTQVHYTYSGRTPTFKGIKRDGDKEPLASSSIVYNGAFTITGNNNRPTSKGGPTVLKFRSYKLVNGEVSPNEKSKVVIVKFFHKDS